ncbi:hypothetical protein MHYP_G00252420 [Metynnis hypsauchen]
MDVSGGITVNISPRMEATGVIPRAARRSCGVTGLEDVPLPEDRRPAEGWTGMLSGRVPEPFCPDGVQKTPLTLETPLGTFSSTVVSTRTLRRGCTLGGCGIILRCCGNKMT